MRSGFSEAGGAIGKAIRYAFHFLFISDGMKYSYQP
jgi:hypothetical protein